MYTTYKAEKKHIRHSYMTGVGISNKPEQGIAMHKCKILPTRLCTLISFCEEKGEEWEL